jgi:hypothetical protein
MEQMLEYLVAAIEEMDAHIKEMKAGQQNLEQGMLAKMETNQERMNAKRDANKEKM